MVDAIFEVQVPEQFADHVHKELHDLMSDIGAGLGYVVKCVAWEKEADTKHFAVGSHGFIWTVVNGVIDGDKITGDCTLVWTPADNSQYSSFNIGHKASSLEGSFTFVEVQKF